MDHEGWIIIGFFAMVAVLGISVTRCASDTMEKKVNFLTTCIQSRSVDECEKLVKTLY